MTKRILVVDDHDDNQKIMRDLLGNSDYEMMESENGEQAVAMVAQQRPDLILMDIQLPSSMATRPRGGSRLTQRYSRSRSLRSVPMP